MKLRESLYLLAPAILLLGVGFALRHRSAATVLVNEPFRLRVEKVRFEPVTPREVFNGYDTKAILVLGHLGAKPNWWDKGMSGYGSEDSGDILLVRPDGKNVVTGRDTLVSEPFLDKKSGEWRAKILLDVAEIPPARGELRFRDWIGFDKGNGNPAIPALPVNFRIRKAGEATKIPAINRVSPLQVEKIFLSPDLNNREATRVKIWVSGPEGFGGRQSHVRAYNSRGEETGFYGGIDTDYAAFPNPHGSYFGESGENSRASFNRFMHAFSGTIDSDSPLARLEAVFPFEEEWPLRVPVKLRDSKGQRIFTSATSQNLKLESARLRPATKDERSIYKAPWVAAFKISLSNPTPRPENWVYSLDYGNGAHLENGEGVTWWQSNLITKATPPHLHEKIPCQLWTEAEGLKPTRYSIAYFFDTKEIPFGEKPLFFKDTLRLDDGAPLEIKLQIRR